MRNNGWKLCLLVAILVANYLIVHVGSRGRHCENLQRDNVNITCPLTCECCLRNSHCYDTSLVINCSQYNQQEPGFVNDLVTMLQGFKASGIVLRVFDLRFARLMFIPDEICATTSLEELHLTQLRLTNISASCIQRLTNLRILNLGLNNIVKLPDDLLYGLTELEELRLFNNQIVDVQPEIFSFAANMTQIRLIELQSNRLTTLDIWPLFFRTEHLVINVMDNNVSTFTNRLQQNLKCSTKEGGYGASILLAGNNVHHLMDIVTGYGVKSVRDPILLCLFFSSVFTFHLYKNPLICDCVDYQLYNILEFVRKSGSMEDMYCAQPPALQDEKLIRVLEHMDQFVCDITDNCPPQCTCFDQPYTNLLVVQCDNRKLSDLATTLPALSKQHFSYGYFVNYSYNSIVTVPLRQYYSQSTIIRLDNNHITTVEVDVLALVVNVTEIRLNNNLLTSLPPQVQNFSWSNLVAIHLYDNPWSCDCHSLWMKYWLQLHHNKIVNLNAITCSTDDVRNGRSLTVVSDDDFVCGHIMSTTEMLWVVVPTVIACVIVVVGTTVVTLYAKRKWLYKRFKLHPFDVDECDGEHKTHDVFLSGADEDTDAIMVLYSKLQQLGYRVCYHKIDFVPGVPTIENIDSAITHSKRTLCYVTRSFVQSDWCKWEFENALNRDLTNKRHRLIAIVDDVNYTDVTYSSLRQYMQTYTYIERHADDFMHTLMYSLAQRKLGGHQEHEEQMIEVEDNSQDVADDPLINIS